MSRSKTGERKIPVYLLTVLTFLYFQGFAVCPDLKYVSFSLVFALISKLQGKVFVIQFLRLALANVGFVSDFFLSAYRK